MATFTYIHRSSIPRPHLRPLPLLPQRPRFPADTDCMAMESLRTKTDATLASPIVKSVLTSSSSSSSSPWVWVSVIATSAAIIALILPYPFIYSSEKSPPYLPPSSPSPSSSPTPSSFPPPPRQMPLVIAVLSARNHFELRRAIRDTWLGQIQTSQKLKNRVR